MSIDENFDRDISILEDMELIRQPKQYRNRSDPFEVADNVFYSNYRFDKVSADYIVNLVQLDDIYSNRGLPISKQLQVLIALRFFGRNAHQDDIANFHGVSQPSRSRIISRVAKSLALLLQNFIQFPTSGAIPEVKRKFYGMARFPCVLGVIDCTHVQIKCPASCVGEQMAGSFLNRKGYYSINVQIVCDSKYKIIDIVARSRGSRHDARIWNTCSLKSFMENTRNIHQGILLGDSAYPNSRIMLTPFRHPENEVQERYNRSHIATRSKIECLNGQMKSKFCAIFQRLHFKLSTAKSIIIAVAILHNIAKERQLSYLDGNNYDEEAINAVISGPTSNSNAGLVFRQAFANTHFT